MMKKHIALLGVSSCFLLFFVATALEAQSATWTLGATEFLIETEANTGIYSESKDSLSNIAKLLPSLILSDIELPTIRVLDSSELFARNDKLLRDEHETLIADYESEVTKRDKLVIMSSEDLDYKDQLKTSEKAVSDAKTALTQNEVDQKQLSEKKFLSTTENVELYKNDSTELYVLSSKKDVSDDVNALLTGTLHSFGTYFQVKVQLILYPGQKEVYTKTVTFLPNEVKDIAFKLAKELLVIIQNRNLVQLKFQLLPQEIEENTNIRVDGEIVKPDENGFVMVSRNFHQISFYCEGYQLAQTHADFTEKDIYTIKVTLEKVINHEIKLNSTAPIDELFVNGKEYNPEEPFIVSMLPALGQVVVSPDATTYLILNSGGTLTINPNLQDISSLIEKRRRTMYNSYGALILSLPFSFISYGMYVDAYYSAYSYGYSNGTDSTYTDLVSKQDNLETVSNVFKCISIGLGVNMVIQIIRYIKTVNKVLPEQVESDKPQ
jgi:hypothetical protein